MRPKRKPSRSGHPATRVLAALEILQTRGRVGGAELAARLEVDRRTVRRYIALLEEIGVPVTTGRGPAGGYELVAGYKLPPMMFGNDEALALSLGLAAVRGLGLTDAAPAIAGAQAKLERVMPANLRDRVRSVEASVAFAGTQPSSPGAAAALSILSSAAHAQRGVHLIYRAPSGVETGRDFDPYGLAFRSGRWYVAGYCHLRLGLRSFRLDRVIDITSQTRPFERPAEFDVLSHLAAAIATLPRRFTIEVWLETDLESARRELFEAIGVLEPCGGGVLLHAQADDLMWFARELARLPWRFDVRTPAELTEAVREHARRLLALTARDGPDSATPSPATGSTRRPEAAIRTTGTRAHRSGGRPANR